MILVAGVLVLLFIVAVAFVVRTQSSRLTARAQKEASLNRSDVDRVSHAVSQEISDALFVRKLRPGPSMISNPDWTTWERMPLNDAQSRYEIDDFTWDFDGPLGTDPQRKFNHARHDVTPSTNWPDWPAVDVWPDDQPGDPGIADARWLRDLEPLRHATAFSLGGDGLVRELDAFSHYRHLTNLSRPDNSWRIVKDISDITGERTQALWDDGDDSTFPGGIDTAWLDGGIHTNLRIPIEQWTSQQPLGPPSFSGQFYDPFYGNVRFPIQSPTDVVGFEDFNLRWMQWGWFSDPTDPTSSGYDTVIINNLAQQIPPNFYDLSDLVAWDEDGDGTNDIGGSGERISDAFVGPGDEDQDGNVWPHGTPRWNVQRRLDDSDGDGFTDAMWHLSPFDDDPDTRTIISISITDNSGRLNANVASRFIRSDIDTMQGGHEDFADRTRGWTPADLALIGQNFGDTSNKTVGAPETHANWNVGFLDADTNRPGQAEQQDGFFPAEAWIKYGPRGADGTWYPNNDSEILVDWLPKQWKAGVDTAQTSVLRERNVRRNPFFPRPYDFGDLGAAHDTHLADNRLFWWQHAGMRPWDPDQTFQNFGLASELELRYHEGQNHPWLTSRFEHAVSPLKHTYTAEGQKWWGSPLRTGKKGNPTYSPPTGHYWNASSGGDGFAIFREEASELGDQLSNRQLVFDNRRKLTLFNGARNETAPPWLWWDARVRDIDGTGNGVFCPDWLASVPPWELDSNASMNWHCAELEFALPFFEQHRQKIDLRAFENPNSPHQQERLAWYEAWASMNRANGTLEPYRLLHERLPDAIFLALTSGQADPDHGNGNRDSYFGEDSADIEKTRDMAAAMAANMLAYSDFDAQAPLHTQIADETMRADTASAPFPARTEIGALAKPDLAGDSVSNVQERFLGIEAQPFFTEAFIAHVYEPWEIPESTDWEYANSGDHMFIDSDDWENTVDSFNWTGMDVSEARTFLKNARPADPKTIVVVQISNPFDRPIPLFVTDPASGWAVPDPDGSGRRIPLYRISLWDQDVDLGDNLVTLETGDQLLPDYLPPATDERPYTLTLYAMATSIEEDWLDFLDLEAVWQPGANRAARQEDQFYGDSIFRQDGSELVIQQGELVARVPSGWAIDREYYDANTGMNTQSLELFRRHYRNWGDWMNESEEFQDDWGNVTVWDYDEWVLVDRAAVGVTDAFKIAVRDMATPWDRPPMLSDIRPEIEKPMKIGGINPAQIEFNTIVKYPDGPDEDSDKDTVDWTLPTTTADWAARFGGGTNVRLAQWVRFTRAWGVDPQFNGHGPTSWPEYNLNERNPRYIFTHADVWRSWYQDEDFDDEHGPNAYRTEASYEQVSDDGEAWDFDDDGTYDLLVKELDEGDEHVLDGTEFDRDDRPFRSWFNFRSSLFNPASKPDGSALVMGPSDPNRLPWFTRNHKLPSTWLDDTDGDGDGQLDEWIVYRNRKPTFFDLNRDGDPRTFQEFVANTPSDAIAARYAFPDKGFYPTKHFPLQLLQKDASFEQIGELNNVWLFGHKIMVDNSGTVPVYTETTKTFSEYMSESLSDIDQDIYVNRLGQDVNGESYGNIIGDTVTISAVPEPAMPAGLRLFDLFVCDGPGLVDHMDVNNQPYPDGVPDSLDQMAIWYSDNQDFIPAFGNAAEFAGESTPGLVNINTATVEVMRALPHMYKMVHADPGRNGVDGDYWGWLDLHDGDTFDFNLRVAIPEAIVQYREMQGLDDDRTGYASGPDYHQRDAEHEGLHTGRGMRGVGEVLMLQEPAADGYGNYPEPQGMFVHPMAWTADFAVGGRDDTFGINGNPFGLTPLSVANGGGGASEDPRHWDDHADFNGLNLDLNDYAGGPPIGAYLSTDVVEGVPWYDLSTVHQRRVPRYGDWPAALGVDDPLRRQYELSGDRVAGDSEEAGLLFAGISNLITTRSDVFTVHMHVRKVRRDPVTGYFDGTDKASIIDDARYVMLIDRSEVDVPSDSPVIRYLQKVPQ